MPNFTPTLGPFYPHSTNEHPSVRTLHIQPCCPRSHMRPQQQSIEECKCKAVRVIWPVKREFGIHRALVDSRLWKPELMSSGPEVIAGGRWYVGQQVRCTVGDIERGLWKWKTWGETTTIIPPELSFLFYCICLASNPIGQGFKTDNPRPNDSPLLDVVFESYGSLWGEKKGARAVRSATLEKPQCWWCSRPTLHRTGQSLTWEASDRRFQSAYTSWPTTAAAVRDSSGMLETLPGNPCRETMDRGYR